MFKHEAIEGTEYPYVVYYLIADVPDNTFTESIEDVLIQFSLFSNDSGSTEIEDMFEHLKTLYDDCILTITGGTCLYMRRENANLTKETNTTESGAESVWVYHVDYNIKTKVG